MKKLMNQKKQEKELAEHLERAAANENTEIPSAPPDEFLKIIQEMDRRKIAPKIREELNRGNTVWKKTQENDS